MFRSVYGKFLLARNIEKDSLKIRISLNEDLENLKEKNLEKNWLLEPGFINLSYEKSDLRFNDITTQIISRLTT